MSDVIELDERLELFFGGASDAVATVYARVRGFEADGRHALAGWLRGPECRYAQTLPARFAFVDRGRGASLLAAATVPEPCFWTPRMPHLYQANVTMLREDAAVASADRVVGLRRFGAVGRDLRFDNQRWVVRGIAHKSTTSPELLAACYGTSAALFVRQPSEELCREASRAGVLLIAEIDQGDIATMRRWVRWPAVGMVVLRAADPAALDALAELGRVCLLAQRFGPEESVTPAAWAQAAVVEVGDLTVLPRRIAEPNVPLIALRPLHESVEIPSARAECDRLQRDLSASGALAGGDWSGYVV